MKLGMFGVLCVLKLYRYSCLIINDCGSAGYFSVSLLSTLAVSTPYTSNKNGGALATEVLMLGVYTKSV